MRRRAVVIAVAALVFAVWFVITAFLLASAARHLQHGRDTASETVDALQPATLLSSDVADPLDRAAADLRAAHRELHNPLVGPLRALPVLGRQVRSIDASASTAGQVLQVAATTLRRAQTIADRPITDGASRLALVRDLASAVHDARGNLSDLHLGPDEALIGPVRTVHHDVVRRVGEARDTLRKAEDALVATDRLLGGPSHYLVVAANNAEMRAGSGMWLTGGVLTTQDGKLSLGDMKSIYEIATPKKGAVTIDDADLRANWSWMQPDIEWRSLMASPRFTASAALGAKMWAASGHEPVDGILALDAVGLGDLVAATGPVTLNGKPFDRDATIRELLHDQYVRFDSIGQGARREALSDVASAVFDRLDAGAWKAEDLVRQVTDAVRGRHLMIWAADSTLQRGWSGASASGALHANSLAVSFLNRSGTKLDWFLSSSAKMTTRRDGKDTVATVTVTFANKVPAGEPTYVVGPYPGADTVAGEYKGVVAVNVPGYARDVSLIGAPTELQRNDGPTRLVGGTLRLRAGETKTVTIRFRVPKGTSVLVEPSARFPAVRWTAPGMAWADDRARSVSM